MLNRHAMKALLFTLLLLTISPAHAYLGPGLGAGTIGVILGIAGSILLALFAIFWYPIKRMLKKKKDTQTNEEDQSGEGKSE